MTVSLADELAKLPPVKPGLLSIEDVAASLEALGCEPRWSPSQPTLYACCPVHEETRPSLSVSEAEDGTVLAHCHRCELEWDRKEWARKFFRVVREQKSAPAAQQKTAKASTKPKRYAELRAVCQYVYLRPDGFPLARLLRSEVTDRQTGEVSRLLTWWRPFEFTDGSGRYSWIAGLAGVPKPLPLWLENRVRARIAEGGAVLYLTEGESDAHAAITRARVAATCAPGGAGKFRPEHTQALAGAAQVVVVADHDAAGLADAAQRAAMVAEVIGADRVRLVRPPVPGDDLRDLLEKGGTVHDLEDWQPDAAPVDTQPVDTQGSEPAPGLTPAADARSRFVPGGSFLLDIPATTPAVWGHGQQVLWPEGEALMIAGGSGLGKTTLAGQVVMARLGLLTEVLGLPVHPGKRVLYLAMDRPAQTRRALARLFTEEHRAVLDDRLTFWPGPPERDMAEDISLLAELCSDADADTVIVDSLKDAAVGLSEDAVGAGWNRARQTALRAGVQVLELHHMTKRNSEGKPPDSLADVYGSMHLTSGAGSVVVLTGSAGDPIVGWRHLKQPAEEVGPWQIEHDHEAGRSWVHHAADPLQLAKAGPLTARRLAQLTTGDEKPSKAELQKARRRLEKLASAGLMVVTKGSGQDPDTYDLPALPSAWSAA